MDAQYKQLYKTYVKNRSQYVKQCEEIRKDKKKFQDYYSESNSKYLIPYPDLDDPDFNEKLSNKKEFFITKSDLPDLNQTFDQIAKSKCSVDNFILTQNQKFVHNFLNPLTPYNGLILFHRVGVGKCHSINTPIIMYDGTIKKVQDVKVGDQVMGDDSTSRRVLSLGRGQDQMYDVIPVKGEKYTVNSEHILSLKATNLGVSFQINQSKRKYRAELFDNKNCKTIFKSFTTRDEAQNYVNAFPEENKYIDLSIKDYLKLSKKMQTTLKGYRVGVNFPAKAVDFDPYIIGLWIGDGHTHDSRITNQDATVLHYLNKTLPKYGLMLSFNASSYYTYGIIRENPKVSNHKFLKSLRKNHMLKNKHIADMYKINSREVRLQVLAGLVDSDGYLGKENNMYEILQKNKRVSDDVLYLVRSLGFAGYQKECNKSCVHKGVKITGTYYRIIFSGHGVEQILVKIPRKRANKRLQKKDALVTGIKVVAAGRNNYYGFTLDGNHRFLLGDFTVTHNTASAIIVAETYYQIYQKRILAVMSQKLKENFKRQIFDVTKYNIFTDESHQCTGNLYPDMLIDKEHLRSLAKVKSESEVNSEIMKRVNQIIKTRYEFIGFIELANKIESQLSIADVEGLTPEQKLEKLEAARKNIDKLYGNRLIIVDEVHNLRVGGSFRDTKFSSDHFLEMINKTSGVKLMLLTATPMFNNATELIWIMNLLLSNDKRSLMKNSEIFDGQERLKPGAERIIIEKTRGYVSYMRGENPFTFPFRLYPSINGRELDRKKYQIDLSLIGCEMSQYQKKIYQYFSGDIDFNDQDLDNYSENNSKNNLQIIIQVSNICYPNKELRKKSARIEWRKAYGDLGWGNNFQQSGRKWKYRDQTHQFLKYDLISQFSPKIKGILDSIISSKGIILVHSRYYSSGINPLIIALEHIGFMQYKHDNFAGEISVDDQFEIMKKKWKYISLSGDPHSKMNMDRLINDCRRNSNKNGDEIKVILITSVASEGIDFKNIREVHLLEPWFNLNKTEQIIGRAIRNCSHIALPKEQRNVTVYQWANVTEDFDAVDVILYRISERKQKIINQIEKILQENSIDCYLNKNILNYPKNQLKIKFNISTSQGQEIENFNIGDADSEIVKCGNNTFDFDTIKHPDDTTFNKFFIKDDINLLKLKIAALYHSKIYYNFKEIENVLQCNTELLAFSLDEMLKERYRLKNDRLNWGRLIYRSNLYIFQPETQSDVSLTLDQRGYNNKIRDKYRIEMPRTEEKHVPAKIEIYQILQEKFDKYYNWIAQVVNPHIVSLLHQLNQTIGYSQFNHLFALLKAGKIDDSSVTTANDFDLEKINRLLANEKKPIKETFSISQSLQLFIDLKFKRLSGRNIGMCSQYVIDSIVDMLNLEEFIELVSVVKNHENTKSNSHELNKMLMASIRDIFVDSDQKCFWCYIDQNYYILRNSKYQEMLPYEKIEMQSDVAVFEKKWIPIHPNDSVGYVSWDSSKKKTVFKIKKSSSRPGSVCQQSSDNAAGISQLIINYFPQLILKHGSDVYDNFKIKVEILCYIYEIVLRTLPPYLNVNSNRRGSIFLRPLLLNSKLNRKK